MTTGSMNVHILSLKCVQAQENNGDEIYITVDKHTLWSAGKYHMSEQLADDGQIDEVDFANGRVHGRGGWGPMEDFDPARFIVPVGSGVRIQVKERDMLLGDDMFGQVEVRPADAAHGHIQLAFTAQGAYYLFSYEVTK
jgi:hypothetical protein